MLVSLDTLRADRLRAWGGKDGLTPSLDSFAEEAVVFDQAYAQASETLFSHASLFSGRYPSELGRIDYSFRLPEGVPVLAEILALYGYRTAAFTAGGHLGEGFGFERGFDTFEVCGQWASLYHTGPPAIAWVDAATGPTFLFVHAYDTHPRYLKPTPFGHLETGPPPWPEVAEAAVQAANGTHSIIDGRYFPGRSEAQVLHVEGIRPRSAREREALASENAAAIPFTDADTGHVRAVYDGAVRYVDTLFGLFVSALDARGLLDTSIVVVLSDHGEELGEDGTFNHRLSLSDSVVHVPLMVRLPGGARGGTRVPEQVGLIDLMPTLVEAAGGTAPAGIAGRSLWQGLQGGEVSGREVVFAEGTFRMVSARRGPDRLLFTGVGADSPYLADLLAHARLDGPAFEASETVTPEDRERLRADLVAWRATLPPAAGEGAPVTPEQRAMLRERGYWEVR